MGVTARPVLRSRRVTGWLLEQIGWAAGGLLKRTGICRHGELMEQQAEQRDQRDPTAMASTVKRHPFECLWPPKKSIRRLAGCGVAMEGRGSAASMNDRRRARSHLSVS